MACDVLEMVRRNPKKAEFTVCKTLETITMSFEMMRAALSDVAWGDCIAVTSS